MMIKKLLALVLSLAMMCALLSGCGSETATTATDTHSAQEQETTQATENPSGEDSEKAKEITLDDIAALNGCKVEDLNVVYDEDGNLTFIGNQISDETIENSEAALSFVRNELAQLLGIDGINLAEYSSYSSPKTDVTYYRFQQTINSDIFGDGEEIPVKYLVNSVKLGVDADGHPVVVASDLNHSELSIDDYYFMSAEEAEEVVSEMFPGASIHSDNTVLSIWNDNSAKGNEATDAEVCLAYQVYADNTNTDSDKPYMCYFIRAIMSEIDSPFIGMMVADSLTTYAKAVDNTSLAFFDNMEDVGEYTYTINFDWMNEEDRGYAVQFTGADSMDVTVPVMYCQSDGLYYLGLKEHYVTLSNYLDAQMSYGDLDSLNPYVTDDPTNLASWHFRTAVNEEAGITYTDDPNYVIASFAEYVKIVNTFGEEFSMYENYPTDSYLLQVYALDATTLYAVMSGTADYPTDVTGFLYNASNAGRNYDWICFNTSPNLGLCLDDVVMGHEFTHGVNMHFTSSDYLNECGAVMESLADLIGYEMAATINDKITGWLVGGDYAPVFRNLGNPNSVASPQYKDGAYYVNPVERAFQLGQELDAGGVHKNSAIPSYLGYLLVNGDENTSSDELLSIKEGLNLWYETLYITCYDTDFEALGAYVKYAADKLGYTDAQQNHIASLLIDLGFEDGNVNQEILDGENSREISIHLDFEDETVAQTYYFSDKCIGSGYVFYRTGGYVNNQDQTIKVKDEDIFSDFMLFCQSEDMMTYGTYYAGNISFSDVKDQMTFHVKKVDVDANGQLTIDPTEKIMNINYDGNFTLSTDSSTGATIVIPGFADSIIITKAEGSADGEFNAYMLASAESGNLSAG